MALGGVTDGQIANENTFDSGYIFKNADDTTIGTLGLANTTNVDSGAPIANTQRAINETFDAVGMTGEGDANRKVYSSNQVLIDGENHKQGLEKLDAKFAGITGHDHSGGPGDGPLLTPNSLTGYKLEGRFVQGVNFTTTAANNDDVSSILPDVASYDDLSEGVVCNAPYNRVVIRNISNEQILDTNGNEVYGRITNNSVAYILYYYVDIGGVETAYTFSAPTTIKWYYQKIFDPLVNKPVYDPMTYIPSDNSTADILEATESIYGKTILSNVVAQSIGAANVKGTSQRVSHEDHVHQGVHSVSKSGDTALFGDITLSASGGATLTQVGQNIDINATSTPLSGSNPSDIGSTASAGVSTSASRDDHVHKGIRSIKKLGDTALFGDVTIEQGSGITLTQTANNIKIDSTGGGSGGGDLNLITNGNAETTPSVIALYTAGTIGTRPAGTQTSGAAQLSTSISAIAPLAGLNSYLLTKAAANAQGQNFSIPFTVDPAYRGKVLKISFDYILNSGTFVAGNNFGTPSDSDIIVYIYNVTDGIYQEPSNFRLLSNSTTVSEKYQAEFQTTITSSSYRLLFHVSTTSAQAYELKVDNISVGPNSYVNATPMTDLSAPTTITVGATTTAPTKGTINTDSVRYARRADFGVFIYNYRQTTAGSAGSGDYLYSLPAGLSFDLSKTSTYTGSTSGLTTVAGLTGLISASGGFSDNTNGQFTYISVYDATRFRIHTLLSTTNGSYHSSTNSPYSNTNLAFKVTFEAPIQGWSSSIQMSNQTDTREIIAKYTHNSGQAITASKSTLIMTTRVKDTHGCYDTGNGRFISKVPKTYRVSASWISANLTLGTTQAIHIYIDKNGSEIKAARLIGSGGTGQNYNPQITTNVDLLAGEYIEIKAACDTNTTVASGTPTVSVEIEAIQGPSAIAATETIAASYWLSANLAVSANTPINFDSKEYDSHNCVTTGNGTWKFTAPVSALYEFEAYIDNESATGAANIIYKNGVSHKTMMYLDANGVNGFYSGSTKVRLLAGEYIDLRPAGAGQTFFGGAMSSASRVAITRVGNYV